MIDIKLKKINEISAMWFIFGFITLISFSVYFGYSRLNASWKGRPGKSGGNPYQYKVVKHKSKTVALLIGINGPTGLDFSFKKENGVDRLFKFLGLSQEHETGHQEFDEMIYIVSDDANLHKLISSRAVIQESAIEIFKLAEKYNCKTKEIRCNSGRLWVKLKTVAGFDKGIVSSLCAEVVPQLSALAGELKQFPIVSPFGLKDPFVVKAAIILAISTGLAINGIVHLMRLAWTKVPFTVDNGLLWMDSLYWGAGIVAVLIIGTLFLLGRSARTHLVLIELILIGSFGAISTAFAELRDINMEMDESTAVVYEVKVTGKRISKSRRSTSYYLYVTDWNNEEVQKKIEVSRALYNFVPEQSYLFVTQKQGYLAYRWVEGLHHKD